MGILEKSEAFDEFGEWVGKHYPYLQYKVLYNIHDLRFLAESVHYPYDIKHPFDERYETFQQRTDDFIRSIRLLKAWMFINNERIVYEHLWNKL